MIWFENNIEELKRHSCGELSDDLIVRQEALRIVRIVIHNIPFELPAEKLKSQVTKKPKELFFSVEHYLYEIFGIKLKLTSRKTFVVEQAIVDPRWLELTTPAKEKILAGLLQTINDLKSVSLQSLFDLLGEVDDEFEMPTGEQVCHLIRASRNPNLRKNINLFLSETNTPTICDLLLTLFAMKKIQWRDIDDSSPTVIPHAC